MSNINMSFSKMIKKNEMKIYNKTLAKITALFFLTIACFSCTDLLNPDSENILGTGQMYNNIDDANAAIRGIYGKLMDCATQYVVLNELRADLMDVTSNADLSLIEISQHKTVSADNKWASPDNFFSLINTCNDAATNLTAMHKENKINREQYNIRYSEAIAVRSWAYLQLALHFADKEKGGVPYFTKPIDDISDLSTESLAGVPYLKLEVMVDTLLNTMLRIPDLSKITDESLITTISTYNSGYMFIDKKYLLGELYLWNNNYYMAACSFKDIMERGTTEDINNPYDRYKIPFDASATLSTSSCRYNSGYSRYYENDRFSVLNKWPYMFYEIETTNYFDEWLWVLYFDQLTDPNPFIDLFAKDGGSYLLKPSQLAIDNWDKQEQKNSFIGDFRGYYFKPEGYTWVDNSGEEITSYQYTSLFGLPGSYDMVDGAPVIMKYIYNYSSYNANFDLTNKSGRWFLWRAAGIQLHYCEAANRNGQHKIAWSLLNNGIGTNYPGSDPNAADNDYTHRNQTELDYPYDFDARSTNASQLPPNLRQPWFRNTGIRNRVSLKTLAVEGDSLTTIETQVLDESGLELAFEGERWGDLVRLSLRNGDNSILAGKVADKLNRAGLDGESVRTKLMDENNWFLPLK